MRMESDNNSEEKFQKVTLKVQCADLFFLNVNTAFLQYLDDDLKKESTLFLMDKSCTFRMIKLPTIPLKLSLA